MTNRSFKPGNYTIAPLTDIQVAVYYYVTRYLSKWCWEGVNFDINVLNRLCIIDRDGKDVLTVLMRNGFIIVRAFGYIGSSDVTGKKCSEIYMGQPDSITITARICYHLMRDYLYYRNTGNVNKLWVENSHSPINVIPRMLIPGNGKNPEPIPETE